MTPTRLLARPLLSAVFVAGGVDTLRHPEPRVEVAEPVVPTIAGKVGLPADPRLLVTINASVQIGAGLLLAIGKLPRLAAVALVASTVPTTYAGHRFWELDDKQERAQQQVHFLKNLGLIGGLILAAIDTGGAPSVRWRVRRRAERTGSAAKQRVRGSRSAVGKAVHTAAEHLPVG